MAKLISSNCIPQEADVFEKLSQPQSEELFALLSNAGYSQPTLLQSKVVPAVLSGRDLLVETLYADGRTAACLLPLLLSHDAESTRCRALIITPSSDLVKKTALQYRRFVRGNRTAPSVTTLGWDSSIKREAKLLAGDPGIIVGTSSRIIDHLRRNSMDSRELQRIIINLETPVDKHTFLQDVLFILSKVPKKSQIVIFTPTLQDTNSLESRLRHPLTISSEDWDRDNKIQSVYEAADAVHKAELLLSLFLSRRITQGGIFCRTMAVLKTLEKKLTKEGIRSHIISTRTSSRKKEEIFKLFREGSMPCILTISISVLTEIEGIGCAVFFNLPSPPEAYTDISSVLIQDSNAKIITFVTKEESAILQFLQEKNKMKKENFPDNLEVIRGKVEGILQSIRSEEKPDELNQYRKLIKKMVPFSMRSYLSAYLIKEALGNTVRGDKPFRTIFVSIGRNRRVFPKDLSKLFTQVPGITTEEVGSIKVLDNYSFIDIPAHIAQAAIDKLDGSDFHGRKITVNFARKKEEKVLR
jgi:ATP-dependent RNA helicase DeaD